MTDDELQVSLEPLSSPHRTKALAALCERLNETRARFPGSKLYLRFDVKPDPPASLGISGPAARQNRARGGALTGHFACAACQECPTQTCRLLCQDISGPFQRDRDLLSQRS